MAIPLDGILMGQILLTKEEIEALYDEGFTPMEGLDAKCWRYDTYANVVAKAQAKKIHHKIEAMVADGYSLDQILEVLLKEIDKSD